MPFVDVSIRQTLGLVTSCPSLEDITAAAAAQGLQWTGTQLIQQTPAKPARKPAKPAANAPAPNA